MTCTGESASADKGLVLHCSFKEDLLIADGLVRISFFVNDDKHLKMRIVGDRSIRIGREKVRAGPSNIKVSNGPKS